MTYSRQLGLAALCALHAGLVGCKWFGSQARPASGDSPPVALASIAHDPYAGVDWEHDLRLKTQFHEHVQVNPELIQRMDDAGYDAIGLMHYSGVASKDYTWKERHWPPERYLSPDFIAGLKHIKLLFPNAEEVGFDHLTSPFLTTYIAKWQEQYYPKREPWHYASVQEAIDLIHAFGGLAFIAHPWKHANYYAKLHGFTAMEVYNAYCRHKFQIGAQKTDKNSRLRNSWDRVLRDNPAVLGIAVNDWFGVWSDDPRLAAGTRDSGKTIVLAKEVTLAGLRQAVERGAVLAVQDFGADKGQLPRVQAIKTGASSIDIALEPGVPGQVRWIANGTALARMGAKLDLSELTPGTRYVRAEIFTPDGSTTFTQAFALKWSGAVSKSKQKQRAEHSI